MYNIGDVVRIISCNKGVDDLFINKLGTIDEIKPKEYYKYHISFRNDAVDTRGKHFWWIDENMELFKGNIEEYEETNEEEVYKKIILTTTNNIDGYKVKKYIDVISYEYVIGTGIFSELAAGFQDFVGARSTAFEEKLSEAKRVSLDIIRYKAHLRGGDAVIGLNMGYASFDSNRVAVIINGTIVKLQSADEG
jgi:uncharacterized protein YbjQ (UPF0145 family)